MVDTKSLDSVVAWMRGQGVVVLKAGGVELALGPEPVKPTSSAKEPEDEELRGEKLKLQAREQMREIAALQYPGVRLSDEELDRLAARHLGIVVGG
jgi:hypothetical protein